MAVGTVKRFFSDSFRGFLTHLLIAVFIKDQSFPPGWSEKDSTFIGYKSCFLVRGFNCTYEKIPLRRSLVLIHSDTIRN